MSKSPFTKAQLLPQEETLEISRQKGELFIGIPKETYFQEKRICLTPDAVTAVVANGHRVLLEKGAGLDGAGNLGVTVQIPRQLADCRSFCLEFEMEILFG